MYRDPLWESDKHGPSVCHSREHYPDMNSFREDIRMDEGLIGCRQAQSNRAAADEKRKGWDIAEVIAQFCFTKRKMKSYRRD